MAMRRARRKAAKDPGAGAGPIWLVTAGLLLSCSDAGVPAPNAESGAEVTAMTEPGTPRSEAPPRAQPAPGSALVSLSERGVTVHANQASRRAVLATLERSAGFDLEFAPGTRLEEPVTIDAVDAPLEEVLGNLLEGWPHTLYFGVAASGGRVLEQVDVGDFSAADPAAEVPTKADWTRGKTNWTRGLRKRGVERNPVAEAERRERRERRQDELYAQLDDADPDARARAAEGLSADDRSIPAVSELAANDPDAGVRKAAVSALSDASKEDTAALDALIRTLGDPDPQVVIAALDSIEWVADASVIPHILPLLDHPNAEVREAAANCIYFLEE
jgi:HEAT repeats/HEAT repeat